MVELLIAVVIIAILASIAVPQFLNAGQRSRESSLRADLYLIRNAIQLFVNDTGVYPAQLSDLTVSTAPASGVNLAGTSTSIIAVQFEGPYLETIPVDPMSTTAFNYSVTAGTVGQVTSSMSGDGLDGTAYSTW